MKFFNRVAAPAAGVAWAAGSAYMFCWAIKDQAKIAEDYYAHGEIPPIKCIAGAGTYIPPRVDSAPKTQSNTHGPK